MKIPALEELMRVAWESGITIPYIKLQITKEDLAMYGMFQNISIFKYESEFGPVTVEVV